MKKINELFFTIEEISKILKVSYLTVYRWIKSNKLISYKFGKQYRINREDFKNFLEKNKKYG